MKKLKTLAYKLLAATCAVCLLCALSILGGCVSQSVPGGINYNETIEEIANPDNGVYKTATIKLTDGGYTGDKLSVDGGLLRLRVGLGDYCLFSGGVRALSHGAVQGLIDALTLLRRANATALLCFSYDDFKDAPLKEPPLNTMISHIRQLKSVFYDCEDVITAVQVSFAGRHGSFSGGAAAGEANMYRIASELLAATERNTFVLMSAPRYIYGYLGYTLGEAVGKDFVKYSDGARLGLFNAAYLTSLNDGGFYTDRSAEMTWLYRRSAFYGAQTGDCEEGFNGSGSYASQEMLVTHTSFLDGENGENLRRWKAETYTGNDSAYAQQSYYRYIVNRLGYRLLLTQSSLPKKMGRGDKIPLSFAIKNLGCGDVIRDKKAEIIFSGGGRTYCYGVDVDVTLIGSLTQKEFNVSVKTDRGMEKGDYKVFLRVAARAYAEGEGGGNIRFANDGNGYDETLGANLLGSVTVR